MSFAAGLAALLAAALALITRAFAFALGPGATLFALAALLARAARMAAPALLGTTALAAHSVHRVKKPFMVSQDYLSPFQSD